MEREAIHNLVKWKESKRRKPLIIEGARQVGKTWLVKEFASKHYKDLIYINFEEMSFLRNLFDIDFDVYRIIEMIESATHQKCIPEETLIFFDEIQEAPNGVTALKYFKENMPQQHIIAAGSLLGISLHRHISFPVGKVQFMTLYPMSFYEFLNAQGEEGLQKYLQEERWSNIDIFADRIKSLLKTYYYVGGMPEAVATYCDTHNLLEVREVHKEILSSYERDFSKHAPQEIVPRIRHLWLSLPSQLSRENRKFVYGLVREGARAREYKLALQWLIDAGLIYSIHCVSTPRLPLSAYIDLSAFKIFMLDVGLLGAMAGLDARTVTEGATIFTEFKGALTEEFVLQQLILSHHPYYYAKSNSRMEIDFLIQKNQEIIPIEVKAEENLRAKSLRLFADTYHPNTVYRLSMSPYRQESWMTNLPLYCTQNI